MFHISDIEYNGIWGDWGTKRLCSDYGGSYVTKFKVRIERSTWWSDDTALNAIRLECDNGQWLYSAEQDWGDWYSGSTSTSGFTGK